MYTNGYICIYREGGGEICVCVCVCKERSGMSLQLHGRLTRKVPTRIQMDMMVYLISRLCAVSLNSNYSCCVY